MYIVGYEITGEYLPWGGFEGFNEVAYTFIAHKECAYNHEDLNSGSDHDALRKITPEEAQAKSLVCSYCERPLIEKQRFAFQEGENNG